MSSRVWVQMTMTSVRRSPVDLVDSVRATGCERRQSSCRQPSRPGCRRTPPRRRYAASTLADRVNVSDHGRRGCRPSSWASTMSSSTEPGLPSSASPGRVDRCASAQHRRAKARKPQRDAWTSRHPRGPSAAVRRAHAGLARRPPAPARWSAVKDSVRSSAPSLVRCSPARSICQAPGSASQRSQPSAAMRTLVARGPVHGPPIAGLDQAARTNRLILGRGTSASRSARSPGRSRPRGTWLERGKGGRAATG